MPNCYFCSAEATTMEHVPPKSLSSAGTKRITVPACPAHNTFRSYDDEYFRIVLCATAWDKVPDDVKEKIKRSARRGRGPAKTIIARSYSGRGSDGNYDVDINRFNNCVESIARALIYHKHALHHRSDRRPHIISSFMECTFDAPTDVVHHYSTLRSMADDLLKELPYETDAEPVMKYKATRSSVQFMIYEKLKFTVCFDG